MFKNYYLGSYKNFSSDIGPLILTISQHGDNLVGLELGVYKADSLMTILENCSNIKTLFGVDDYKTYTDMFEGRDILEFESDMIRAESLLKQKHSKQSHKIKFLECSSLEAVNQINDGDLDFIFVDANHSYDSVLQDLTIWYAKVKPGGLIMGHDYLMPTVEKAVNDFREQHNIKNKLSNYLSCYVWKK